MFLFLWYYDVGVVLYNIRSGLNLLYRKTIISLLSSLLKYFLFSIQYHVYTQR